MIISYIEKARFDNDFFYKITSNPKIDADTIKIPSMLLQPYVENAIVWGIDLKIPIAGKIRIQVNETEDNIDISIQDNGVGIEASQQSNGHLKRNPEESGAQIVRDRLQLLKSLGIFIQCEVQSDFNGTQVFIKYPKIKS